MKISKLVEVKVLNESHNTQCLGSVVPLAILTLCALNLQPFHISIGSQGTSIWGETLDEDFELLCCEGYLVTVGGVRSILLPFTWHGWGRRNFKCNILTKHRKLCKPMTFHISNLLHIIFCCTKSQKVKDLSKHCDLEMLTSHIGKRGLYPQYGFILTLLPVGKK